MLYIVFVLLFCRLATAQENVEAHTQDFVSITLPYPLDFVRGRILTQFDSEARSYYEDYNRFIYDLPEKVLSYKDLSPDSYRKFMALPMIKPSKFYVFYGAYAVKQRIIATLSPLDVVGLSNPALARYAELPLSARTNDVYLWSPDVPYWHSEYVMNGKRLPFKTYFILHITAGGDNATIVEAIEHKPVVRIEDHPALDENGLHQPHAVREVPPTTHERVFLLSCIRQFIEREVPVRSRFNCKEEEAPGK